MLTIGITGGIGSGKSTVTDFFAQLGIAIVDADIVARNIVAPGTACLEKIALHFGPHILDHNGHLNRRKLRDIIFTQPSERAWLEQLTHPLIQEATQHALSLTTSPYRIYTAPLLLEVGQNTRLDRNSTNWNGTDWNGTDWIGIVLIVTELIVSELIGSEKY